MTRSVSQAAAIYRQIVSRSLAPRMAFYGFRPVGAVGFGKSPDSDSYWQVGCAFTKVRGRDEGWLEAGVCVGFRSVARFLADCPVVAARSVSVKSPCLLGGEPWLSATALSVPQMAPSSPD